MIDERHWLELAKAEDEAYFKGDLVLSLPKGSYTVEEMWEVVKEMFRTTIAIHDAMRADFESLSGVKSPEWWFNVLLAEQEELPEGILD